MEGGARKRSIPAEQRVFSLVLALVASPSGLTRSELLSSVYGYSDRFEVGGAHSALERQFERDKEHVRSIGIRIETLFPPGEPDNTQLVRYRISKDLLQLPANVRFSARELSLLRLASMAWAEGSLSAESRRAAMKLESLGAGLDVRHLGLAPSIGISEPAAPALQRAIDEGRVVRFDYRLPEREAPYERRVAPLRLHRADARWHLIAWDLDRKADRVFLLARIVGEVRIASERFSAELRDRTEAALAGLLELKERQRATVEVRRGSVAEARLGSRGEWQAHPADASVAELELGTLDLPELARELAGYGDEVAVREPARLRDDVVSRLRQVVQQHAAASPRDLASAQGAREADDA